MLHCDSCRELILEDEPISEAQRGVMHDACIDRALAALADGVEVGYLAAAAPDARDQEVIRLRAALAWYADPGHYDREVLYSVRVGTGIPTTEWTSAAESDRGGRARAALAPGEPSAEPSTEE